MVSLGIALAWTIPVGVLIGTNRRAAAILQPVVQVTASVPATAIFPVFLLLVVNLAGGLNIAAIFLMLMGTQWYLLFNVIAGGQRHPARPEVHRRADGAERLGALAHPDSARPVPLRRHRRHHRQRRGLERQHRGRIASSSAGKRSSPPASAHSSRRPPPAETTSCWPPPSAWC